MLRTSFPVLTRAKRISIDIETHDPDLGKKGPGVRRDGYVVGVAVRTENWAGEYYPIRHNGPNLDAGNVFGWLRDNLNGYAGEVVGANLLYDADYLQYEDSGQPDAGMTCSGPKRCWTKPRIPTRSKPWPTNTWERGGAQCLPITIHLTIKSANLRCARTAPKRPSAG